MSLILDALRKIEQERRYAEDHGDASPRAVGPERSRRNRSLALLLTMMTAIAALSAVLTVGALKFLRPAEKSLEAASAPETPAEAPRMASAEIPVASVERGVAPDPPTRDPGPVPRPEPSRAAAPAPPDLPPPDPEPSGVFRLVGQGSSNRTASFEEPAPNPTKTDPELPLLVLQGTSVIDGKPVAVISDRRVFEGDHIEGAVVIRIQERTVELEFEGRRFTLSL